MKRKDKNLTIVFGCLNKIINTYKWHSYNKLNYIFMYFLWDWSPDFLCFPSDKGRKFTQIVNFQNDITFFIFVPESKYSKAILKVIHTSFQWNQTWWFSHRAQAFRAELEFWESQTHDLQHWHLSLPILVLDIIRTGQMLVRSMLE